MRSVLIIFLGKALRAGSDYGGDSTEISCRPSAPYGIIKALQYRKGKPGKTGKKGHESFKREMEKGIGTGGDAHHGICHGNSGVR